MISGICVVSSFAAAVVVAASPTWKDTDFNLDTVYGPLPEPPTGQIVPLEDFELDFNSLNERDKKKYSRRLWTLDCDRRGQCHCFSRELKIHFCCHCSWGNCFPADATVAVKDARGRVRMDRLKTSDWVLVGSKNGELEFSPVLGFLDRRASDLGVMVTLVTQSGREVTLSPSHHLWVNGEDRSAGEVTPGDLLHVIPEGGHDQVVNVTLGVRSGAFVPLTSHGTLVVGGILTSCYSGAPHNLAHFALTPVRIFPRFFLTANGRFGEPTKYIRGLRNLARVVFPEQDYSSVIRFKEGFLS